MSAEKAKRGVKVPRIELNSRLAPVDINSTTWIYLNRRSFTLHMAVYHGGAYIKTAQVRIYLSKLGEIRAVPKARRSKRAPRKPARGRKPDA